MDITRALIISILVVISTGLRAEDHSGAKIEDYIVGAPYEIVAVDGKPPVRDSHWLVTVVPFVIVQAGEHKLKVRRANVGLDSVKDEKTFELEIEVLDGHRYRLDEINGKPVIADKKAKP
jgi:hypothetical protein